MANPEVAALAERVTAHLVEIADGTCSFSAEDLLGVEDDGVREMLGCLLHLHELHRYQEHAREAGERRWRAFCESAADAIILVDDAWLITSWNPAAERMFGYTASEALRHRVSQLVPERMRGDGWFGLTSGKGCGEHDLFGQLITGAGLRKDGSEFPTELTFARWQEQERWHYGCILRDVSVRRRLEAELLQVQKLDSISRLAAGIAHEIQTPLQWLGDQATFLRRATGALLGVVDHVDVCLSQDPVTHPCAEVVRVAMREADLAFLRERIPVAIDALLGGIDSISTIVTSMRALSHPAAACVAACDVNATVELAVRMSRSEWRPAADVHLALGADVASIRGNAQELRQALVNCLTNAAHAIEDRGGERGTITVRTRRIGSLVRISVADDGVGIPLAIRDRLFDPYFTTKDVGRGTGQGLAIARAIVVQRHHGSLSFESEEGRGTTFYIDLPGLPP